MTDFRDLLLEAELRLTFLAAAAEGLGGEAEEIHLPRDVYSGLSWALEDVLSLIKQALEADCSYCAQRRQEKDCKALAEE